MTLLASAILGMDGVLYLFLGFSMICLSHVAALRDLVTLYPSLFKPLRAHPADSESAPLVMAPPDLLADLGYRMLGYLLMFLGVFRTLTAFHWDCGYVYLGLGTCLGEIGMICNELLHQESLFLHRAMAVLLGNVVLSILYICNAIPTCG